MNVLSSVFRDETASLGRDNESLSGICTETSMSTRQDFLVFVGQVTRAIAWGIPHTVSLIHYLCLLRRWVCQLSSAQPPDPAASPAFSCRSLLQTSPAILCTSRFPSHDGGKCLKHSSRKFVSSGFSARGRAQVSHVPTDIAWCNLHQGEFPHPM